MSSNEINPGNGLESGVRSSAGLPGSISDTNRDLFEQQLSKAHSSLGGIPIDPLLESDDGFNAGASYDGSVNGASSRRNEFESGIPSIDFVARQVGKVLDVVDKTVEEGASVRQFISETTAHVSEVIHERADVARRNWNAPDNELREVLTDRLQRGVGFLKKLSASLSENPDARELMDNAITVGRNLAEKTSDAIQNAQFATESFLEGVHNEVYGKSSLPLGQASSRDRQAHPSVGVIDLGHPFVGVIDTGFEAQDHGTQVVSVIQEVGHQFPDWLANSVGSGTWSESLVNFADAARASERFNAVANLSFDLTQLNSDGSISTRYEFTTEEREALKYAQANGVLVVVSAGNQGGTMSALGQASQEFDNVIAVGASEGGQRADYSSYGSGLDFVASGQGKAEVEGTSLAAARVTGAIARIWDANSQLDYRQVIQTLEATATDLQQPGWDHETGFGQLNPSAAIKLAEGLASQLQGSLTSPVLQNLSEKNQINQDIPSGSVWQQSNDAILIERPNSLIAGNAASYPGYSLKFNPSAPEYNEAPAVVRIWQQRMNDLGYKINVDGQYGQQSVSVARQFQQAKGLGVDGIVGPQTWAASFSLGTPTAVSKSSPHQGRSADAAERWTRSDLANNAVFSNDTSSVSKSLPHQGGSADATERRIQSALAGKAASYPGYSLKFNPSAPEYNEAPAVVRVWQQRMNDLGYKINVDGQYGQQSVNVARQFQQAKGLGVDGIVGPQTWSASFSPGTPTTGSKSLPHQGGSADATGRRAIDRLDKFQPSTSNLPLGMKFRVDSWIFNYQSSSERDDYLRENLSNFWKTPPGNVISRPPVLEGPWVKLPYYRREQQLYQEVITEYLSDTVKDLDEYISIQGPTFSLEDIPIPAPVGIPGKLDLGFTLISYENGFLHTGEKSRIAAGDFSPLSLFANREFIAPGNSLEVAWNPRLRFSSVALEGVGYGFEARHGEDIDGDGFGEYGAAIRGLLPLDVGFRLEPGSIIESIREDS